MKDRFTELWNHTMPASAGGCPQADPDAVLRRVNNALDAAPRERRSYMNHKLRVAAVAVAAALVLTGTALAAGVHSDILASFFKGDTAPGQAYLDETVRTVSDENYTMTVEGAAADENMIYLTVTFAAKNEETREFLFSEEFTDMDTFSVHAETKGEDETMGVTGLSCGELDSPEEGARRFALRVHSTGSVDTLWLRCGYMDEDAGVEIPVQPAPSVTVEIGASGVGVPDYETLTPGTLTVDRVILTPFTCTVETSKTPMIREDLISPYIAFRMTDGTIRTRSQMLTPVSSVVRNEEKMRFVGSIYYGDRCFSYQFQEVQDLGEIASVIAFDVEYPLDGGKPVQLAHNALLDGFTLPRMKPLSEDDGFSISVQALTEGLGGVYEWNESEGEAICTARGVTMRLRPGEAAALVDGETVELLDAPAFQEGVLAADVGVFEDAWGIDSFVLRSHEENSEKIVWHDWYIIP